MSVFEMESVERLRKKNSLGPHDTDSDGYVQCCSLRNDTIKWRSFEIPLLSDLYQKWYTQIWFYLTSITCVKINNLNKVTKN